MTTSLSKSHKIFSHANKSALYYTFTIKVGLIHDTIWYEVIYEYAACMIFWYFKIIQVRSNLWGSGRQISIVIKLKKLGLEKWFMLIKFKINSDINIINRLKYIQMKENETRYDKKQGINMLNIILRHVLHFF